MGRVIMPSMARKRFSPSGVFACVVCVFLFTNVSGQTEPPDAAEAFEVGAADLDRLPKGKEADGIVGDFVLRNALIEALVAGNQPLRKANMTVHSAVPTPGCLYDLCARGSRSDQLTILAPGNLQGTISSVRIVSKANGEGSPWAHVRAERTGATAGGLEQVHDYLLGPGWRHLIVVSTYRNLGSAPENVQPAPFWKGLSGETTALGIRSADAMDPLDRQAYAVAPIDWPGCVNSLDEFDLASGAERRIAIAVAPGISPAAAWGTLAALRGTTGTLRGTIRGPRIRSIATASVEIPIDGKKLAAYPDAAGEFAVLLPPGEYALVARDIGRPDVSIAATVRPGETAAVAFSMAEAARVSFEISGAGAENTPCKVQFRGTGGTKDPDLGPTIRAHGCRNQYHSETGWFTVAVPPGSYRVVLTRGIEFGHHEEDIQVRPGRTTRVQAVLERMVDSRGWVSTDFHNHSTPSGDNYCGTDDRIINLAAEGVEFAPTTEHNRFYDWAPHIERLGLSSELSTIVGIELTGSGPHLNSFPFRVVPGAQDGGAPQWNRDPRINAITLRDYQGGSPSRWVQLNHPTVGEYLRDRNGDGVADGGFIGLEALIDAAEVWSDRILSFDPVVRDVDKTTGKPRRYQNRTFAWLQLLNQGRRIQCLAVADAHEVFNGGVGGWRTFIPSSTDDPARIDAAEIIRNAKAGRMVVTNGPFLEASLDDGTPPGGLSVHASPVRLAVRVQCNSWVNIDRVQVLVNGRAPPELDFRLSKHPDLFPVGARAALRFEKTIEVPLAEDAWIIAVAYGENFKLETGYGLSWQSELHPCAFHNPIYVDIDGNGFRSNGDTLGHPLPVMFPMRRRL